MTRQMETNKKTAQLFLLAVLQVCTLGTEACPPHPDKNLTCYTDFDRNISCVWNTTYLSEHKDAPCTLRAERIKCSPNRSYHASCDLEPAQVSRPALRRCSLYFTQKRSIFQTFHELSINLSCVPAKDILTVSYKPICHIKLNPPGKPGINGTAASWFNQQGDGKENTRYITQLQWKRWNQSWSDPSVQTKSKGCLRSCEAQLDADSLALGERHEARVRVQSETTGSTWSDWSPIASWESSVGIPRPPSQLLGVDKYKQISSLTGAMITAGAALALILVIVLFRREKATWVFERIRGPDPGKSFLKDVNSWNWLSPHFTKESFLSPGLEDISDVEVVSTVNADTPRKDAALLEELRSETSNGSTSSSFFNPSYSHLCRPPPFPLPPAVNVEPPASDAPGGAPPREREEERMREQEILLLLSKGISSDSEPVPVVSDYEKVEKLQVERLRLQSLDSGMCSGEEVSQESLEAEDISARESHEEKEGGSGFVLVFQKLFGGSGSVFGKGSIQVCSDYEQVQKLQPESPELPSLDSGVSSGGEERVSQEDSLEEDDADKSSESTHFLLSPPPPASIALPRSGISFPQKKFSGLGPSHRAGRMEPSGDGYMPARQETC